MTVKIADLESLQRRAQRSRQRSLWIPEAGRPRRDFLDVSHLPFIGTMAREFVEETRGIHIASLRAAPPRTIRVQARDY